MEVTTIFIMMFLLSLMSNATSQILVDPESLTVLPYANVSSTCVVKGGLFARLVFEKPINKAFVYNSDSNSLSDYDIFVSYNKDENDDSSYNTTWTVTLIASEKNNMTKFYCEVLIGSDKYSSNTATITVEDDTITPEISIYNSTYIELSWSPLANFEVNNYLISIYNASTKSTTTISTNNTSYVLSRDHLAMQCNAITVTIQANTDVGSVSNTLITGFPKDLLEVNESDVTIEVLKKQNGRIKTMVQFTPPDVCSYQVINYNITANSSTTTYQYPTITGQMTQLTIDQHLEENAIYTLTMKVWEKYRESIVYITNVTFDTNFDIPAPSSCPKTSDIPPVISEDTNFQTTSSYPKTSDVPPVISGESKQSLETIFVGFGAVIFTLIIMFVIIIVLMSIFLVKLKNKQKIRTTPDVEQMEVTPQLPRIMANNPLYEGSNTLYECLPQDVKGITKTTPQSTTAVDRTLYMDIPPQVPAPRKNTLDSPGIKSGTELSLTKYHTTGSIGTTATNGNSIDQTDGQYIYMKSLTPQPRYLKSPLIHSKKEESLTIKNINNTADDNKEKI